LEGEGRVRVVEYKGADATNPSPQSSPLAKGRGLRRTSEVEATRWNLRADDAKHRKVFGVEQ